MPAYIDHFNMCSDDMIFSNDVGLILSPFEKGCEMRHAIVTDFLILIRSWIVYQRDSRCT